MDAIVRSYWKRFHREYVLGLQLRQKMNSSANPLWVGIVAIILYENTPLLHGPLGITEEEFERTDAIVGWLRYAVN